MLNTGDSLIAMGVDIEDNHSGFGFGLYSPRVTRSVSNLSSDSGSEDQESSASHDRFFDARLLEDVGEFSTEPLLNILGGSPCSNPTIHRNPATPKDATNNQCDIQQRTPVCRERRTSTGKENLLSRQMGSPLSTSTAIDSSTSRNGARSLDVYNFEGSTPQKEEEAELCEIAQEAERSLNVGRPVRAALSFTGFQQGARMENKTEEINLCPTEQMNSQPLDEDLDKLDFFEKPAAVPRLQPRDPAGAPRSLTALTLVTPESVSFGKSLAISPGYGKWDHGGSSTCSSCVSSPIILQSESQCFTYSVRRYIESYGLGRPDSPVDVEGERAHYKTHYDF